MNRQIASTLAAATALAFAAPALAQDDAMLPMCSATVTDHCRQHEGMSGAMMHHGKMMHHKSTRHHARHARNAHAATPATPAMPGGKMMSATPAKPAMPAHKM